jgi:hypothetical protein
MRYLVVFATVVGALALAPAAGANEYLFVGSDGTRCIVDTSRTIAPETGGTWSAALEAEAACSRPLLFATVRTYVGTADDPFGYEYGGWGDSCGTYWGLGEPCDRDTITASGTRTGLAPGSYEQGTQVSLYLDHAPPPSWVVVPLKDHRPESASFATSCRPVYADTSCHFRERFAAG